MGLNSTVNTNIGEVMTKRANKKNKVVRDVKGAAEKQPEPIQVIPGNTNIITVQLLSAILGELRKMNVGPK